MLEANRKGLAPKSVPKPARAFEDPPRDPNHDPLSSLGCLPLLTDLRLDGTRPPGTLVATERSQKTSEVAAAARHRNK